MSKKLRDTKVGKFLDSNGFQAVLDVVGGLVPGGKVLNTVKDMVLGDKKWKELPEAIRNEFLELHALELEELDLILKDVTNARSREIEIAKTGKKDWLMPVVVITVIILFIGMIAITVFVKISPVMFETFQDLKTTVRDIFLMACTYYLGSSRGSSRKTDLLTK